MYEIYYLIIKKGEKIYFTDYNTQKSPDLVSFDYKKVLKYEDSEEFEIIGFYHTHPVNCNYMSDIDIKTMKAWRNCLGRDLLCMIRSGNDLNMWRFSKKDFSKLL